MMRVKIRSHEGGNRVEIDGRDISNAVTSIEIKITPEPTNEIKLTLLADIDVELEADLLKMEKAGHARFVTLDRDRPVRFVKTGKS